MVHDVNLAGGDVEVIDEFPFFSFLLADNHPHMLALPFVVTAIGFAFQSLVGAGERVFAMSRLRDRWDPSRLLLPAAMVLVAVVAFVRAVDLARTGSGPAGVILGVVMALLVAAGVFGIVIFFTYWFLGRLPSLMSGTEYAFAIWLFGGLAFLNTWDFPIYLSLLMLVLLWRGGGWPKRSDLMSAVWTGLALVLGGVMLYLPWYPSFSSQAGGLLPNLLYATKVQQLVVMFGPALVPILGWLVWRAVRQRRQIAWRRFAGIAIGIPVGLLLVSWGLASVIAFSINVSGSGLDSVLGPMGAAELVRRHPGRVGGAVLASVHPAFDGPGSGTLRCPALAEGIQPMSSDAAIPALSLTQPQVFTLLMTGIGALLVVGPEFLYLKDLFGDRMNTVFKFYFATWILWGAAGAFILVELWPRRGRVGGASAPCSSSRLSWGWCIQWLPRGPRPTASNQEAVGPWTATRTCCGITRGMRQPSPGSTRTCVAG